MQDFGGMRKQDALYGCMCKIFVVFGEMDDVDLMKWNLSFG